MKISKKRFMRYEKARQSGKMNMMAYGDKEVLCNYTPLYKHFIEDKKEEDCEIVEESQSDFLDYPIIPLISD